MNAPPTAPAAPGNRLRRALDSGRPAVGTFVFSPDPAHSEIVGLSGFDYAVIDTEHAPLGALHVSDHARACALTGATPIARVRADEPADIGRMLDAGARGIMLPHVGLDRSRTEAAVQATRYAPHGRRPTCTGVRAVDYGLGVFADHAKASNDEVVTIGLIEDKEAVDHVEDFLAESSLDVVIPGTGDLATSYGVPGEHQHPLVVEAVERVVAAAQAGGRVRPGLYVQSAAAAAPWADRGVAMFLVSIDLRVLANAYRGLRADFDDLTDRAEATR